MILAVDIGNSQIVMGIPQAGTIEKFRIPTHPISSPLGLRAQIGQALATRGLDFSDIEKMVVSSVVPEVTHHLREAFSHAEVIDCHWPFSIQLTTKPPEETGIDRLVNAEAAWRFYGGPAIIVDAGTATTIDALSADGTFLGGAILPGMEMMRDALGSKAAQLFSVDLKPPHQAIGVNTELALQSGLVLGYASMIDGMIRRLKNEMQSDTSKTPAPQVIATGGLCSILFGLCSELPLVDEHLTLKGIFALYESFCARPAETHTSK
ncbi:type III pantothenate kinase [Bdellovibrionota bacterium FG-1]